MKTNKSSSMIHVALILGILGILLLVVSVTFYMFLNTAVVGAYYPGTLIGLVGTAHMGLFAIGLLGNLIAAFIVVAFVKPERKLPWLLLVAGIVAVLVGGYFALSDVPNTQVKKYKFNDEVYAIPGVYGPSTESEFSDTISIKVAYPELTPKYANGYTNEGLVLKKVTISSEEDFERYSSTCKGVGGVNKNGTKSGCFVRDRYVYYVSNSTETGVSGGPQMEDTLIALLESFKVR